VATKGSFSVPASLYNIVVNRVAKGGTNYVVKVALPCLAVSNIMRSHMLTDLSLAFDQTRPLFSCSSGVVFGPG
jgi:hypothetical protein